MTADRAPRPANSRLRAVEAGASSWAEVLVIDLDHQGEGLRAALEQFGLRVTLAPIGQARHLVAALSDPGGAEYVVLSGHGDDGDILIPELSAELEAQQPFHRVLTPEVVSRYAHLNDALVISTGCGTATSAMGAAMLGCGATGYLAPTAAPYGYAAFFAVTFLFYELTQSRNIKQAITRLGRHDPELSMWRLHTPWRWSVGRRSRLRSSVAKAEFTVRL